MTRRTPKPDLSPQAQSAFDAYSHYLKESVDLRPATIRNYLSDLRQFIAWFERQHDHPFHSDQVTTPTLTAYRLYLKDDLDRKPSTINRHLVTLKRYFAWTTERGEIARDPAKPVRLVGEESNTPRHMADTDEQALLASVERSQNERDITIIKLMLHTGLRAGEVCGLRWDQVVLHKRSGYLKIWGKRNKYREVPLNRTSRATLNDFHQQCTNPDGVVFRSVKTGEALTTRALGFIVKKYAQRANLDVRPHDLRHRFGYRMAQTTPLHRLAQIMGHDSLDTTLRYVQATRGDLQRDVEQIAWE